MFNLDYETYSESHLAKVGAYRYAADPSAEILLAAVCEDDGPVELWGRFATPEQNAKAMRVITRMSLSTEPVSAFNAPFEIAVSTYLWAKSFGLPMPALERWRCSAALCRIAGMPSSLEKAAEFLKLPDGKDPVGKALIKIFSIPDPKTGKRNLPTDGTMVTVAGNKIAIAEAWRLFRNYCIRDVEVERDIQNRLKELELKGFPLDAFILDTKMNARGIPINLDGVAKAQRIVDDYNLLMGTRFTDMTGFKPGQTAKVLAWLKERGYPGEDLRASTVTRILTGEVIDDETGDETAAPVQPEWAKMTAEGVEALRVRSLLSYAALKKLPTMAAAACPDDKVHGAILYYGASRTGRSSGKLIQIQNFRRNTIGEIGPKGEEVPLTHYAYDMICSGTCTADDLELCFGQPLEVIASSIRHFIHPKEGKFLDIDLAQIEARVLAWLSGHSDLLQSFREGKDLYKQTASLTFDVPYEEVTKDLRFLGKVVSLACGYAGGFNAFATMARMFGVEVPEKRAKEIVKQYRKNNPAIKNFWRDAQDAAVQAIRSPGIWVEINPLLRCIVSNYLGFPSMVIELPSKRRIYYPYPEVHSAYKRKVQTLDAEGQPADKWIPVSKANALNADGSVRDGIWESDQISYYGAITAASWGRCFTAGGVIVENICQGTAADFLTHGVLNAEREGYETIFVVHDQGLFSYRPEAGNTLEGLTEAFCRVPDWAPGFPLAAEGKIADYYSK